MEPPTGLVDDFDGQPLPEGTEPVVLTFDSLSYTIHLSAANVEKLQEALRPFVANADVEGHTGRMNNMRLLDDGRLPEPLRTRGTISHVTSRPTEAQRLSDLAAAAPGQGPDRPGVRAAPGRRCARTLTRFVWESTLA